MKNGEKEVYTSTYMQLILLYEPLKFVSVHLTHPVYVLLIHSCSLFVSILSVVMIHPSGMLIGNHPRNMVSTGILR